MLYQFEKIRNGEDMSTLKIPPARICSYCKEGYMDGDDHVCPNKKPATAGDFLSRSKDLLEERGKEYDNVHGERSMEKTVRAFNAITGRYTFTEAEGWLFMQILKDVRQWQSPKFHRDSAEDCVSYAALKAESLAKNKQTD